MSMHAIYLKRHSIPINYLSFRIGVTFYIGSEVDLLQICLSQVDLYWGAMND